MKVFILVFIFIASALCSTGIDVSTAVATTDFACLVKGGYTFAIIRCFQSTGVVDPNCASNAANAKSAGMDVDIYLFPCFKCGNAFDQMNNLSSYLTSKSVKYTTLWLDIEGTQYWGTQAANQQFFTQLTGAGERLNLRMGVYTSQSQWEPIMGASTAGSIYPIWYAHYDGSKSFTDFAAFGGWKTPYMKQYAGDAKACGVGIDENWLPGGNSTTDSTATLATATTDRTTATTDRTTATHATVTTDRTTATTDRTTATHATTSHSTATSETSKTSSQTTYSSGGDSSGSGSEFQLSHGSIYNAKLGGGKYVPKFDAEEKPTATKTKSKAAKISEAEDQAEKDSHFKIMEERTAIKF